MAFTNFGFFQYLNGKFADGSNRIMPQSYVSTSSNILATLFQILLQFSLGIAFVQYLWYLLRTSALQVSTIETLFNLRSSPFSIFQVTTLKRAPILTSLVFKIWSLYLATSFPPGAITVVSEVYTNVTLMTVPTFNASFVCQTCPHSPEIAN